MSETFLHDFYEAWETHGARGLERVIDEDPAKFLGVVGAAVPKDCRLELAFTNEQS